VAYFNTMLSLSCPDWGEPRRFSVHSRFKSVTSWMVFRRVIGYDEHYEGVSKSTRTGSPERELQM